LLVQNPCGLRLTSPAYSGVTIFSFITADLYAKLWGALLFWPCIGTAWQLADFDVYSAAAGQCERENLTHHKLDALALAMLKDRS
jgi:hypothetical protein